MQPLYQHAEKLNTRRRRVCCSFPFHSATSQEPMRTYTIDQLEDAEIAAVNTRLTSMELQAGLEGIYWLPVPRNMLTPLQVEHEGQCGPYCLALEVEDNSLHLELLVRGMGRIRCGCIAFAAPALRDHMIAYLESMLTELGVGF